jgi:hypothetical protein
VYRSVAQNNACNPEERMPEARERWINERSRENGSEFYSH